MYCGCEHRERREEVWCSITSLKKIQVSSSISNSGFGMPQLLSGETPRKVVNHPDLEFKQSLVQILGPPLTTCLTLVKVTYLSKSQISQL